MSRWTREEMIEFIRDELVDMRELAEMTGLAESSLRVYATKDPDFPTPVIPRGPAPGQQQYFLRVDAEAYVAARQADEG